MRIVILNPFMRSGYSGPTVLMHRLFGELVSRGLRVIAIGREAPSERVRGIEYVTLHGPALQSCGGQLVWLLQCSRWLFVHRKSYDLVHIHGAYLYNLMPSLVSRKLARPYVILPVAVDADLRMGARSNRIPLVRSFKRRAVSGSLAGFALAQGNVREFEEWGLSAGKVYRINNPAAADFFREPPAARTSPHTLVFVGEMGYRKAPHIVVWVLAKLVEAGWTDAHAIFIGPYQDEDYRRFFESVVGAGLADRVHVVGYVADVASLLQSVHGLFLLLSSQEGLPGALAEAMAHGMPVVVTAVGAMGQVVSDSGAGLIVEASVQETFDAVSRIWRDPTLYREMGLRAAAYARVHFSPQAAASTYLKALTTIEGSL